MALSRRKFLAASGAASLPLLSGAKVPFGLPKSRLFDALSSDESDRVLVLINLTGGNDGLNTIVPLDQVDNLAAVRANIALPQNRLVALDELNALHPALEPLKALWDDDKFGIVRGVGYPDQNRSHFRSSDIWNTGSEADEVLRTGWFGRYLDGLHPGFPEGYPNSEHTDPIAVSLGNVASETCQGVLGNFTLTVNNPLEVTSLLEGAGGAVPDNEYGRELEFVRTTIAQANAYGQVVQEKTATGRSNGNYPEGNELGRFLSYVVRMISGGLKTKAYIVTLGGFDTHAGQAEAGEPLVGVHNELLTTLGEAVAAFQADLEAQGLQERVIGMTYSEFGRRIRSNDAVGTDHGSAAPMMLFGSCVRAGVLGQNPTIDRQVDFNEGVPMQYDFRDVYGSVLEDWFGLPTSTVRSVLHDGYQRLPVLRDCDAPVVSVDAFDEGVLSLTAAPSVYESRLRLDFETARAGRVTLEAYDMEGRVIETLFSKRLPAGEQSVNVDAGAYPRGVVVFRLREGDAVRVVRTVRL